MRGSRVARTIDLEEKRVHAPIPMIQEPFLSLPAVTPTMTTMGEDPEPVLQEPTEPVVDHARELQQEKVESVPDNEALQRSNRTRRPAISTD